MVQVRIFAKNIKMAKNKFLKKYPTQDVYDVTREFPWDSYYKKNPNKRFYRVTGVKKKVFFEDVAYGKSGFPIVKFREGTIKKGKLKPGKFFE